MDQWGGATIYIYAYVYVHACIDEFLNEQIYACIHRLLYVHFCGRNLDMLYPAHKSLGQGGVGSQMRPP